jgi:hypothetical protein
LSWLFNDLLNNLFHWLFDWLLNSPVGVGGGVVGHGGAAGIGMWRELRCGWLRLQALGLNRQQAGAAAQRHDR